MRPNFHRTTNAPQTERFRISELFRINFSEWLGFGTKVAKLAEQRRSCLNRCVDATPYPKSLNLHSLDLSSNWRNIVFSLLIVIPGKITLKLSDATSSPPSDDHDVSLWKSERLTIHRVPVCTVEVKRGQIWFLCFICDSIRVDPFSAVSVNEERSRGVGRGA